MVKDMMYEVEIIHKGTLKVITVETDTFKSEYEVDRLGGTNKKYTISNWNTKRKTLCKMVR